MAVDSKRIIRGTFGEVWLDGDKLSECKKLLAKVEKNKEEFEQCGKLGTDTRTMGYKGTGSITIFKVNSRMHKKLSEAIKSGEEIRLQILSAIKDPSAYGAERVLVKDADFDDLTLIDWEAGVKGEVECPFTFSDWENIDLIEPRE